MMTRVSKALWAIAFSAVALSTSGVAHADDVDDLFAQGNAAFQAGKLEEAYDKLLTAWKIRETFDIAANLSVVEMKLGKTRDAAEHLDYALHVFPATGDKKVQTRMEEDLEKMKLEVGRVVIQVPPNSTVQIDGVVVGRSPLPNVIYVEPGTRVVLAEHPTLGSGRAEVACVKGREVTVMVELKPRTSGPHHAVHRSIAPAIVGFAVGAAGLAVGGALLGVHGGQLSDAQKLGQGRTCQKGSNTGCQDIASAASKANTTGNASIGAFVVGGVGIAAGTGLLIWALTGGESSSATGDHVSVTPIVGPGAGGAVVDGRF